VSLHRKLQAKTVAVVFCIGAVTPTELTLFYYFIIDDVELKNCPVCFISTFAFTEAVKA